jgi:hypothetical protein
MFTSPPLPLPPEFPLRQLISLVNEKQQAGAWIRESGACHRLSITASGRCVAVMIGEDLGELLRCCSHVILRADSAPAVVPAGTLIRWRVLEIVTGAAHFSAADRLYQIFPGIELDAEGFRVPIAHHSPEEILADCLQHDISVAKSRVVYRH